jgi:uncharacterized integral membrane protein
MSAAALINVFQILTLVGAALTAAKLFHTGLHRRYRFFFWYFLFLLPNTTWPLFLSVKGSPYFVLWTVTEPLTWIFHTLVVLELYRLVLEKHKGLYTLGRWAMFAGIGTSVTISLISLIPRLAVSMTEQSKTMFWYLAMERGLMLGLAIFLLFMMGFLVLYTVPISRNVKTHARIYSIFFVSNFLTFLMRSLLGRHVGLLTNTIANAVSTLCVFAWLFLLNPAGEEVQTSQAVISPEQERRVLQHLDALNATLLRVSAK